MAEICLDLHANDPQPVEKMKLKRSWIVQQYNNLKHTSKSIMKLLKEREIKDLEQSVQFPKLNITENLWRKISSMPFMLIDPRISNLEDFLQ